MDSTGEQLHPNWRALTTIHIPIKRFIKEGDQDIHKGTHDKQLAKHEILGVNGEEIKEFYEDLVNKQGNKETTRAIKQNIPKKLVKVPKEHKQEFEVKKYFHSATKNNVDELKAMEYAGNDINTCDAYGWTSLMMAACEGSYEAVEFLIRLGVDRDIKDKTGRSAKDLAFKKGHFKIVKLLTNGVTEQRPVYNIDIDKETAFQNEPFYCDTCKQNFVETNRKQHQTSTIHQFNMKTDLRVNKLQKFNIPARNRGLQLMVKQGWDKESGLGPSQSGRLYPVKTVIRKQRSGLGIEQQAARVTHFEAFDRKAVERHNSDYYKKKSRNRHDIKREKVREWKRNRRLRNDLKIRHIMSKTTEQKCMEILKSTEEVADKVLVNKQELINLDRRRQQNREAIRELEKSADKKVWTTIGSMLVKLERQKALELLKKDQTQIEREINILQSDQKILVNKHRDLEHFSPYSGTHIKPLDRKEFNALKANLPML